MDIPVDSINKTDRHNIAQILWKVVLSIINKSNQHEAYMFNVYLALLEYIAVKCHPAELSKKHQHPKKLDIYRSCVHRTIH